LESLLLSDLLSADDVGDNDDVGDADDDDDEMSGQPILTRSSGVDGVLQVASKADAEADASSWAGLICAISGI